MKETPDLPPAYRLVVLETVESTNTEAARRAREGAPDGTCIWAKAQTGGRGRRGREWVSPPGNLYFSLVLRPEAGPDKVGELGFVAALALRDALGTLVPPLTEVRFKWPNDILINGSKVAGILLESSATGRETVDWVVLGIGVNVESFPEDTEFPATSLAAAGSTDIGPADVLEAFGRCFLAWVNRWLDDGFGPVRASWLNYALGRGEPIEVRLEGETLTGTFEDIDDRGALVLRMAGEDRRVVTAGDVFPVRDSSAG